MDHVVYVDAKAKANDLEEIFTGKRTMIIRGAAGRKLPYGRVQVNDVLYLIRNNGEGIVRGKCDVAQVVNSDKLTKETSIQLVLENQSKLNLSDKQFKRWAGKRYLVLISIKNVQEVDPFYIDRSAYGNMDDWLPVEKIGQIKQKKSTHV
ncbi:MAG: hypothetical protein ACW98F_06190 [Candidatus Hodarchaeales archaeon]|jgi:hypothetical protein